MISTCWSEPERHLSISLGGGQVKILGGRGLWSDPPTRACWKLEWHRQALQYQMLPGSPELCTGCSTPTSCRESSQSEGLWGNVYLCVRGYFWLYPFRHNALYMYLHIHIGVLSTTIGIILFIHHVILFFNSTINCEFLFRPGDLYEMFLRLDYNKSFSCFQKCISFILLNYKTNVCL